MSGTRMADSIMCPPLVRTEKRLHLPDCATIRGRKTWPCKWAEGWTLGAVYDSLQVTGTITPCLRCNPLFRPGAPDLLQRLLDSFDDRLRRIVQWPDYIEPPRPDSAPLDHSDLPPDLLRILRDQSVVIGQDSAVFDVIAQWAKAPSNTASADLTEGRS